MKKKPPMAPPLPAFSGTSSTGTCLTENVSHSIAHYLMAIHQLLNDQGYARSIDVAKQMQRSRGTVSVALKRMEEDGLVVFDKNLFVRLTQKGHDLSHQVLDSKMAVSKFLHEVLGVRKDVAYKDACLIEHHLSSETVQRLVYYLEAHGYNPTPEK